MDTKNTVHQTEYNRGFAVFDAHTHVYPAAIAALAGQNLSKFYQFEIRGAGTVEDLEDGCSRYGVRGFLLLAVATNKNQVQRVNTSLAADLQRARANGFVARAFAAMHQDYPAMEDEVERAVELGFSGFKIHPDIQGVNIDDERLFPLYRALEARRLPICLHMGDFRPQYQFSHVTRLLRVKDKFPDLTVQAAHLGSYRAWENSPLLSDCPGLWFDLSSTTDRLPADETVELIHRLGADRVCYGTDYPICYSDDELRRFFALPLTEAEQRAILWDNAARYLQLEDPA